MNKRHVMARACAPQVAAYQKQRKARRALRRRGIDADGIHIKGKDFGHDHPGHPGHPGHSSTHHSGHPQAPTTATDPSGSSTSLVAGSGSVTSILPTSEVVSSTTSALGPHYSTIQNVSNITASMGYIG
ncbi:hypothetical protein FRB91_011044 [Serendipita sp. 411]|nr:hypothetical protein FRB91_011044 [Serendipita sp. 411]